MNFQTMTTDCIRLIVDSLDSIFTNFPIKEGTFVTYFINLDL